MAILTFSLSPEATSKIYESLICLAKFGESVSLEARSDKLTIAALNLSRTAYAAFALDKKTFFLDYRFVATSAKGGDKFTCQLLNKALQSVFKGRATDSRGRETSVERCDVSIQDQPDKTECRIIVKMLCKQGVTKTYKLAYESVEVMHALFDRTAATQGWKISARVLREYIEYFGPKTEQLDLLAQDGKAIFTSFTEKIQNGKEVLKQPLETAIAIHTEDFEDFHVQEKMHITISVKDFKAIVTHAETMRGSISARFSFPTRPLQFSYQNSGMHCEFTLATTGDYRASSSAPNAQFVSNRSRSRQASAAPTQSPSRSASEMPPPARPIAAKTFGSQSQQTSINARSRQEQPSADDRGSKTLFVSQDNEDTTWDPPNFEQDEDEEMLGWDASNEHPSASFHATIRDSGTAVPSQRQQASYADFDSQGLEPTQRLSQLHGMFD
ncbi:Rad9-domain-containing protein [Neohortaea acidophila]|uniref:DNA repair protein rad9 n=1 Tax=Neohortaea acidophila TaxID=245834 RepID=A0A6A6Q5X8_9PEZI|nr:Rad9-domain-containing protein [Neohortaea acidophila]KAF2487848.1 Rad9-domain-containing protein [Neohortaea acidophila]